MSRSAGHASELLCGFVCLSWGLLSAGCGGPPPPSEGFGDIAGPRPRSKPGFTPPAATPRSGTPDLVDVPRKVASGPEGDGEPQKVEDPERSTPPAATPPTSRPATATRPILPPTPDWPQFRGPRGAGVSGDPDLPLHWSAREGVVWTYKLPGSGASQPIVSGDKVLVTCYRGYGVNPQRPGSLAALRRSIVCVDRGTGELVWTAEIKPDAGEQPLVGRLALHGYATSTPVTDGVNVYTFFGGAGVASFPLSGTPKPKANWVQSVGEKTSNQGSAASPLLFEDLLIVNASVESGTIGALRRDTGEVAWTIPNIDSSWGTPLLVETKTGRTDLVASRRGLVVGYDPRTGLGLWECDGITEDAWPSIVTDGALLFVTGGRSGRVFAIAPGDVGRIMPIWVAPCGATTPSPVPYGRFLFVVNDDGLVTCLDKSSGTVVNERRLGVQVFASPVAADGKLYVVSREQGTFVLAADESLKQLAHNILDASVCNAGPAVAQSRLFLRTNEALYCIQRVAEPKRADETNEPETADP